MAKNEILSAGELDEYIGIFEYTSTQNDYGEITKTKSLIKYVWAKLITTGTKGVEKVMDDTIIARSKINFLVRSDFIYKMDNASISPEEKFCVLYETRYWNISSMESLGRGKGVIIRCYRNDNIR
jgi:head-tail adaptor